MKELCIHRPKGYDPDTQRTVGMFAASLDDQLSRLRRSLEGLGVAQLEWQGHPGRNTIGMLLTHIAAVEVAWLLVSARGVSWEEEGTQILQRVIGVEDDGVPLPPDGTHPDCLRGFELHDYLDMLDRAREKAHEELRSWIDEDLGLMYEVSSRRVTREWTLYHILEHFAAHFGQILLLMHQLRDANLFEGNPG